ncbi:MAG: hypothetical protein LBS79_07755 [Tannerella sp.]|jgi:hypothetical protein|nr:hypothetical protein [Tannerella sp.]
MAKDVNSFPSGRNKIPVEEEISGRSSLTRDDIKNVLRRVAGLPPPHN